MRVQGSRFKVQGSGLKGFSFRVEGLYGLGAALSNCRIFRLTKAIRQLHHEHSCLSLLDAEAAVIIGNTTLCKACGV